MTVRGFFSYFGIFHINESTFRFGFIYFLNCRELGMLNIFSMPSDAPSENNLLNISKLSAMLDETEKTNYT